MAKRSISEVRQDFETLDKQLLSLLAQRSQLSQEMGELKAELQLNTLQPAIWEAHLANRLAENMIFQLDVVFLHKIFNLIHEESLRIQNQILADKK